MFALTVIDHVRLDSEHVARNYMVHARAADRWATAAFASRVAMVVLLAAASSAAIANLLVADRFYQITAAVLSVAATLGFALHTVLGFEARVMAHRAFAHRLWIICERFRSVTAEATDGVIDRTTLLNRRDQLIEQMHAAYERGFAPDQRGFDAERLPPVATEQAA